ncbi:Pectinesterase inhibitor domain [Arabidopsis thaliana x Arabidopsis arenosa]|uniref:pectinesterase n=1 Tax=Arabidopsis thaliana x Arabidopsis arenosa TaxID=1240361 RepID=A0A8T1YZX5_9BRAS|nr:Pectinesterase inhibitor domain [Arabidopsis thaliana x Arabidopsis arenosa]
MSYGYDDDAKRKKRYVIISISSVLLISMVVAVTIGVSVNKSDNGGEGEITTSVKAIKDVCAPTDYKETCEDTLRKDAKDTSDPLELVKTAFNATMKQISDVAKKSQTMIDLQKDPRTKMALDQCKELMDYAIGELSKSFEELGRFEFHKVDEALIKLRIWLSATISHEQTCLDGFQGTQGNAGETIKKALKTAVQLTHNGLAMVSEMSNYLGQMQIPEMNSRRLLSQEFPTWMDGRARRLLNAPMSEVKPDIVVAQDGSGQYKTINEALNYVPKKKNTTFVVHIKAGIYKEYVQVNRSMTHLVFIGDGPDKTVISGSKSYKDGITTYKTATVAIVGDHFIAKNIGFENTAGAIKHQAVAIRVLSDESIFYNCKFDGYQDTLYAHSHRQFYRDCTISGTIDFLFGDAAAVFQNCTLLVRKPLLNQACPITAHGRKDPRESTGFVLQGCTIVGEPDYLAVKENSKAYLGRPWKEYSRTIIMNTFIPDFIPPEGWQPWLGDFGLKTLFYSEVQNTGPGAPITKRVTWPGIKKLSEEEILTFTPAQYIQGDAWIPGKGVPYIPGLFTGNGSTTNPTELGSTNSTITGSGSSSNTTGSSDSPSTVVSPSTSPPAGHLSSPPATPSTIVSPSTSPPAGHFGSPPTTPSSVVSPSTSPPAGHLGSPPTTPSSVVSPSTSPPAGHLGSPPTTPSSVVSPSTSPPAGHLGSPPATPSTVVSPSTSPSASPSASPSSSPSASPSVSPSVSPQSSIG